jgi:hypothetical protein
MYHNVVIPESGNPESNRVPDQIRHDRLDSSGSCLLLVRNGIMHDSMQHLLTPNFPAQNTVTNSGIL